MFSLFKARAPESKNSLFFVVIKIARGTNLEIPENFSGALVPAFAAAPTHELALKAAVVKLQAQGFEFLDVQGSVLQLDPQQWSSYVRGTWPEFEQYLPGQREVIAGVSAGSVFFGPFASYAGA